MYIATIDTPNFNFTAAGNSEDGARAAFMEGWAVHCREYDADIAYIHRDDLRVIEILPGEFWRDHNDKLTNSYGS